MNTTGTKRLIVAIIKQAKKDALQKTIYKSPYFKLHESKAKMSAMEFFDSVWFAQLCTGIEQKPQKIRDMIFGNETKEP